MNVLQQEKKKNQDTTLERPRNFTGRKVQLYYPKKSQASEQEVEQEIDYDKFQKNRRETKPREKSESQSQELKKKSTLKSNPDEQRKSSKSQSKKPLLQKLFEEKKIEYRNTDNFVNLSQDPKQKNTMLVKDIDRPKLDEEEEEDKEDVFVVKTVGRPE